MLKFKWSDAVPPGGKYFYVVPETKTEFSETVYDRLLYQVQRHYHTNNITVPRGLEQSIVDYMCRNLPKDFCVGETRLPRRFILSARQIMDFTSTLFSVQKFRAFGKDPYVSQKEADARAIICGSCEFNMKGVCTTCNNLKGFAARFVSNRVSSHDAGLHVCKLCGCLLSAKVHVKRELLPSSQEYPEHCWMKEK